VNLGLRSSALRCGLATPQPPQLLIHRTTVHSIPNPLPLRQPRMHPPRSSRKWGAVEDSRICPSGRVTAMEANLQGPRSKLPEYTQVFPPKILVLWLILQYRLLSGVATPRDLPPSQRHRRGRLRRQLEAPPHLVHPRNRLHARTQPQPHHAVVPVSGVRVGFHLPSSSLAQRKAGS